MNEFDDNLEGRVCNIIRGCFCEKETLTDQKAELGRAAAQFYALYCEEEPIDAAEFKKRRRASGYTQETFAELLHVHRYTVSRWETGEVQVPLYVVPILGVLKST